MPSTTLIPAGYRFTFKSSESTGDNKKTIIREGVSEDEANLFSELANALKSKKIELSEQPHPTEDQKEKAFQVLWPIFEKYDKVFDYEDLEMFMGDVGVMVDYINDYILDYSTGSCWIRVLDDFEVEYVPENILLQNVTSKFKK